MVERYWWARAQTVSAVIVVTLTAAPAYSDPLQPSLGLYGNTGLIDMPSAEMQPDGETSWTFSNFGPTQRGALNFQLFEGVEMTLRYTSVDDWTLAGDAIFTDAFDVKFRLRKEDARFPAVALGFRDVLGTGVESAEYLVATKTLNPALKVTAGLGWGRLGASGGFSNPFGLISDDFDTRPLQTGSGSVNTDLYFRGDVAAFAGVEWQTPLKGLSLKAEYSSDDYRRTAQNSSLDISTPFNFGVEYRRGSGLAFGAYLMHGSEIGLRLSLSGNPFREAAPQDLGTGPTPVIARPDDVGRDGAWASNPSIRQQLMEAVSKVLEVDGIVLQDVSLMPDVVEVRIENTRIRREPKAVGRVARVLAVAMPASVRTFRITLVRNGLPTTTTVIDRTAFESQVDQPDAGPGSWQSVALEDATFRLHGEGFWAPEPSPRFSWSVGPHLPIRLFANDSSVSYRLQLRGEASYRVARGFTLNSALTQTIAGKSDSSAPLPPASFPQVRSNYGAYEGGSGPELPRLTADYVFKISNDTYGRISGGYLERMFAGFSGEVLWKPVNQNWGLGAELNYVRQRDFDSLFALQDYDVVTGHGSFYWDTGFRDIEAQVDAGRYLGGDWGATVTLSRRFPNGWEVAGYLTGTEATAQVSGSDNIQRGVRVTIPLRWTLPYETRASVSTDFNTGARDDGARIGVSNRLYQIVRDGERQDFYQTWGSFWQ